MRHGRWLVSAAVIVLVVYAAIKVDWRAAMVTTSHAALGPLIAAIAINLASVAIRGLRWWIFLRPLARVPMALAVRGALVGSGFNNLLVANGGDATRVLLVARAAGIRRTAVVATLALDRMFDPICFGLLLFVATFIVPLPAQLSHARPIAGGALVVVAGLLVLLARSEGVLEDPAYATPGVRARLRQFSQQVRSLSTPRRFTAALFVSLAIWGLQVATFALVATSAGIALPVAGTLEALLLTNTGLVLRATPGNIGYFQFAYAIATSPFGVPTDAAVATAVMLQLVQIVPVTVLAVALAPRMLKRRSLAPEMADGLDSGEYRHQRSVIRDA